MARKSTIKNPLAGFENVKTRVELIDAAKAQEWLERNTRNRNMSERGVKRIADDIRHGDWMFNGETVIFASDGVLADGQNRLQAIVDANVQSPGLPVLVVYGISPDAFRTIDSGRSRSAKDDLAVEGLSNTIQLAAAGSLLYSYRNHGSMLPVYRASRKQAVEMVEAEPTLADAITPARAIHKQLPSVWKTHTMVLYHLFNEIDPDLNNLFWKLLVEGVGLEKDSPILLLRNRITGFTGSRVRNAYASAEYAALAIKAWNAWIAGQTMGTLRWKGTGRYAEDFPHISTNVRISPRDI